MPPSPTREPLCAIYKNGGLQMYNLIVWGALEENLCEGYLEIDKGRFLEYTDNYIKTQLDSLSNEAIASIKSWPSLVMNEGRGEEDAYVVEIQNIEVKDSKLILSLSEIPTEPGIKNNVLWRIREQLDIGQFEFTRSHWAVKERNLLQVLEDKGYSFFTNKLFRGLPLPLPERSVLFRARDLMSLWGHTEIDDFLLEAGIPSLKIGRENKSPRDRANDILKFVLDNHGAKTVDNSMFATFFVERTKASILEGEVTDTSEVARNYQGPHNNNERSPNRVFVVHGRNDEARDEVVNFLKSIGLQPIILHEQPNMGRHLLTKFIDEAELVTFAVIVMTADDVGGLSEKELAPRARQNVIFELGYFIAHLGQSRVCALVTPGLETPSDFDGIVYIPMAEDSRWKCELKRELKAAGMPLKE